MTQFVHSPYIPGETIAAIATPPGEGAISIIRLSGDDAISIANKIFSGPIHKYKTHTAHLGKILNEKGECLDEALVLPMIGKRSFCGEDTIEFHCHGGPLVTRLVLELIIKSGARAARPGEFSLKAFMNGKIDLSQAEAIQELIGAKNEHALKAAEKHLEGNLSSEIQSMQRDLLQIAAILEAWVDFPEEGIEFASMESLCEKLLMIQNRMLELSNSFHDGKMIHDGIHLCLAGCPNVGKSSLMNRLLRKDRAIVSNIPGTTRDVLEEQLLLNGLNIKLSDTAGIRDTDEVIEKEGIKRSRQSMREADITLLLLDASKKLNIDDEQLLNEVNPDKTIILWNKIDLQNAGSLPQLNFPHVLHVSALTGEGILSLKEKIDSIIWTNGPPAKDEIMITNIRHKESLEESISASQRLLSGLKNNISPEFLSHDMRQILQGLGKVVGSDITEDILSSIFSTFCIGK